MVSTEIIHVQDALSKTKNYSLAKINNLQQTVRSVGWVGGGGTSKTELRFI